MLKAMDKASPIGPIPENYPYLDELCKKAYIGYRYDSHIRVFRTPRTAKKTIEGKELTVTEYDEHTEETKWRDWFVCFNEKLEPARRRTPTGKIKLDHSRLHKSSSNHAKFQAILDYVLYRWEDALEEYKIDGKMSFTNILNVAIQKEDTLRLPDDSLLDIGKKVGELWKMEWRDVMNECAQLGLRNYHFVGAVKIDDSEEKKPPQKSMKF